MRPRRRCRSSRPGPRPRTGRLTDPSWSGPGRLGLGDGSSAGGLRALQRGRRRRDERLRHRRRRPGTGRRRPRPTRSAPRPRAAPRSLPGPAGRPSPPPSPGATSTNSSPPMRPTVSTSRTDSASTAATRRRMSSPTSWPPAAFVAAEVVDIEEGERHLATPAGRRGPAPAPGCARPSARWRARSAGRVWAMRSNHSERSAAVDAEAGAVGRQGGERRRAPSGSRARPSSSVAGRGPARARSTRA